MGSISAALEDLHEDARSRVLLWAMSHYGVVSGPALKGKEIPAALGDVSHAAPYETFADLFNAASPTTEREKALVAAYWVQVCENAGSFQAQSLNEQLKNLGHGIGNITEALNQLKETRPALIVQLRKSGSSRQARKTYKLTLEGSKRAESMAQGATGIE
jgi:hypothetical protein